MCDVDAIYPLREGAEGLPAGARTAVLGGKAANLLELREAGFPVPDGFVVTASAYRRVLRESGLEGRLFDLLDADPDDPEAVAEGAERAREAIADADFSPALREAVVEAYADLGDRVAVRSSATAEDLPEASFAGQQDTFLNVYGEDDLLDRIKECWASLFTDRALAYRAEQGFSEDAIAIAVVVQEMIDAEKSGVLFTADPASGAREMTIEAAPGLGEAVVSGAVSPDNYVVDRETGEVVSETVRAQEVMYAWDDEAGATATLDVPADLREDGVLDPREREALIEVGERIERHYGRPQDVEWAIRDGEVVVLQSRPITTIDEDREERTDEGGKEGLTLRGLGASGGVAAGRIRLDPIAAVKRAREDEDVILVRETTSPSDVHGMKAAVGILTSKGGTTSHAAIVARELDKPAVVGCESLTVDYDAGRVEVDAHVFEPGDYVRIDGDAGTATFPGE